MASHPLATAWPAFHICLTLFGIALFPPWGR